MNYERIFPWRLSEIGHCHITTTENPQFLPKYYAVGCCSAYFRNVNQNRPFGCVPNIFRIEPNNHTTVWRLAAPHRKCRANSPSKHFWIWERIFAVEFELLFELLQSIAGEVTLVTCHPWNWTKTNTPNRSSRIEVWPNIFFHKVPRKKGHYWHAETWGTPFSRSSKFFKQVIIC